MACRGFREKISAFVDGETSAQESVLVTEHLASCARCRELERGMRALGEGVRQVRRDPSEGFRDAVFARLEAEGALTSEKRAPAFPWRWAAVPLAAAAAVGFFLLARDVARQPSPTGPATARVETPAASGPAGSESAPSASVSARREPAPSPSGSAGGSRVPARRDGGAAASLSPEDREMIALLDILEDPASFETNGDAEGMDLLFPGDSAGKKKPAAGRRGGA